MMKHIEARTLNEEEILDLESRYCSFGDTVHYAKTPKIFEQCEGSWLFDMEGIPYLDMQMWYSAVNLGYRNRKIEAAHNDQMSRLPQLACQYLHKEKVLLASSIAIETENRFGTKGRVHFNVGGSQAIEDSMKLIRNYTKGKSLMFAFMGGYHGRTLGASEITSSYRYRRRYGHFGNRAEFIPYPYCFRCFYDKKFPDCDYECVKHFERLFETEYFSFIDRITAETEHAAFYVESVQGTGGYVIPPPEYLKRLSRVLCKYGILLVDDEIQMGFYRTGKLWAIEHFDVSPDLIVFGKALTNGLNPLSGVWARENLINPEVFPPGSTHSTFSSNPLGTAAGLATMEYMKVHDMETMVAEKGRYFLLRLRELKKKYRVIGDVDGLGLALRIEMTERDGITPDRNLTDTIFEEGLRGDIEIGSNRYGLVLDVGGYYKNTFTLAPALTISFDEIDLFVEMFESLLKRCEV